LKILLKTVLAGAFLACSLAAQTAGPAQTASSQEPENLAIVVDRLMRYHDSGEYDREIREAANAAREYLAARLKDETDRDRLSAVFDIDETALSNWDAMSACGFCAYAVQTKLYPGDHDPPIVPVLELFSFAKRNGIAVFFITGRKESERAVTIKNLNDAGYSGWAGLVMRPDDNKLPARVFKSQERQRLEDKGNKIILNIGDQASDLAGCCAEHVVKLPNPFYLVP
jgi:predicted secreted acid phosphatase